MKLPDHKCGLYLAHNEHRDVYSDVPTWIEGNPIFDWKDEEAKRRAIATDECWSLQFYPETPIGFNSIAAPTLEELLELANEL